MEIPNLKQVDPWTGGPLDTGQHLCVIETAEEGKSRNGHPELTIKLRASDQDSQPGGIITDWITVTPDSLGRVRQFLEACEVTIPDSDIQLNSEELVGRHVQVYVGPHKTPDERSVQRVKSYRRASSD